jgi:hypothetical protein
MAGTTKSTTPYPGKSSDLPRHQPDCQGRCDASGVTAPTYKAICAHAVAGASARELGWREGAAGACVKMGEGSGPPLRSYLYDGSDIGSAVAQKGVGCPIVVFAFAQMRFSVARGEIAGKLPLLAAGAEPVDDGVDDGTRVGCAWTNHWTSPQGYVAPPAPIVCASPPLTELEG